MPNKLTIWNARMLELMQEAQARGMVASAQEYCGQIGIHVSNIAHIRDGNRGFTVEQILAAADLMNKPMDWFFDRAPRPLATDLIAEGLRMLEADRLQVAKSLRKNAKKKVPT